MAIDASGRLFFSSQLVTENELAGKLRHAVAASRPAPTLVIQADKAVSYDTLIHIALLARDSGIHDVLLATQPRIVAAPNQP